MNKDFHQRQQEQMRRQRERQMGAAWLEQQKQKEMEQGAADNPFSRLEGLVAHLRREYAAGRVTKEQAEMELRDSVIEDASGFRWTVGFESGKWYRFENGTWVPTQRPLVRAPAVTPAQVEEKKSRPVLGCLAALFGLILTAAAGFVAAYVAYEILEIRDGDLPAAILVWSIGLLLSLRWGRKVWRRS